MANGLEKACRLKDSHRPRNKPIAHHYHAGMDPAERAHVQNQWSSDEIPIVCATVAFGMGINKPDVRWVVHYTLPKSLEGYAQESGRAGRDGADSDIVLFYQYGDKAKIEFLLVRFHIIRNARIKTVCKYQSCMVSKLRIIWKQTKEDDDPGGKRKTPESLAREIDNLNRAVTFCENDVDCRRKMLLNHFGESFDASMCNESCDNCSGKGGLVAPIDQDNTDKARDLCQLVIDMGDGARVTCSDIVYKSQSCMVYYRRLDDAAYK